MHIRATLVKNELLIRSWEKYLNKQYYQIWSCCCCNSEEQISLLIRIIIPGTFVFVIDLLINLLLNKMIIEEEGDTSVDCQCK